MKNILDYKKDAILSKQMNYSEGGIMTRLQWLKFQMAKGATVNEGTKNRLQYNRTKYNRMTNDREQEEYMKKCTEKVLCYELHLPNESAFWEITKTEYDRFLELQLAEDLATERNEVNMKISAGLATEQEENDLMQKDFDFFKKYAD